MLVRREDYQKKLNLMRRMINGFMCLCLMFPLAGIVALVLGVAQPGGGKGSMTTMGASLVLAAFSVAILVFWRLFSIALNWIAKRQIALLFNGK